MIRELTTVNQVIDALGGTTKAAALLGKRPQAVTNWRNRGSMPADTFLVCGEALKKLNRKAVPALWGIKAGNGAVQRKPKRMKHN